MKVRYESASRHINSVAAVSRLLVALRYSTSGFDILCTVQEKVQQCRVVVTIVSPW